MVKFDPKIHHRRSIRLEDYDYSQAGGYFVTMVTWQRESLFGKVMNGEMTLNRYGEIVLKWWNEIPVHFQNVETGAFVIMPNHVHGIIFILERRGTVSHPVGVPVPKDDGENSISQNNNAVGITQGGETPPLRTFEGTPTLGQIVAYFKYQSTKEMNKVEDASTVTKFWQRNYHEHVIRNEKDLQNKADYIEANPLLWGEDDENPVNVKS
jgi:putative transposase